MGERGPSRFIVPANYPELALLVWNRDPTCPIRAREAFKIYERNWRHLRVDAMTPRERDLVTELAYDFEHGMKLTQAVSTSRRRDRRVEASQRTRPP